ncbi:hypothetical protein AV530_019935 [Patagioenas fasciata monilis]|uniref:Uncharacterized protein n=1 Tax=Patagioenas fasciata monilis TaxID=372326 RepID=A0A1V4J780_PATFA|nr:hypothetical protein AV530_019935 [Patagioenas fasciata monilis]
MMKPWRKANVPPDVAFPAGDASCGSPRPALHAEKHTMGRRVCFIAGLQELASEPFRHHQERKLFSYFTPSLLQALQGGGRHPSGNNLMQI